jgi:hypothetical protein
MLRIQCCESAQHSRAKPCVQRSAAQRSAYRIYLKWKPRPTVRGNRAAGMVVAVPPAREPTLLGESRRQTVALCRTAGNARCATQRGQQALRERSSICCLQHIMHTHASAQQVMHPKGCNIHGAYASCTTDANGAGLCNTRSMRTTRSKHGIRNHATPPRVRVRTCARQGAACAACATAAW